MTDNALKIARAVATALGKGWTATKGVWDNGGDANIAGPDGERVHLASDSYSKRNRLTISGSFNGLHKFKRYNEPRHEITVAADKAPARIAGDITRRLLPGYREGLQLALERKAKSDAADAARAAMVAELRAILGRHVYHVYDDIVSLHGYQRQAKVQDGEVVFTYRVPDAQAADFARYLAGLTIADD